MAGIGRRTLYRKSVMDSYLNENLELENGNIIAQVKAPRGSNILEIRCSNGEESLAMLPTKFRKLIWVKRGDYVVVTGSFGDVTTAQGEEGKVKFIITHILSRDQIKNLQKDGLWPEAFQNALSQSHQYTETLPASQPNLQNERKDTDIEDQVDSEEAEADEDENDLYAFMHKTNPNHVSRHQYHDTSESDNDDVDDGEEVEGGEDVSDNSNQDNKVDKNC